MMKKTLFLMLLLLSTGIITAQEKLSKEEKERREKNIRAGNPFTKFGSKAPVATLSKGKYLEVHDLDSIVTIGTIRWHVEDQKIVGRLIRDKTNPDAQPIGDVAGRWMSPDPLSEEFPSWSPYNFVMNNPIRLVDPDGRAPFDWIVWTSKKGQQHITYDNNIKDLKQARAGIYKNATKVFADGSAHSADYSQRVEFASNGNYLVNNGTKKNIDDGSFTLNKTYISKNKSAIDMAGDIVPGAMQDLGASLTLAALPVSATGFGAPVGAVMATTGGVISTIGTVFELLNDAFEGNLTIEKTATKVGMYLLSRNIGGSNATNIEKIAADNFLNGTDKGLDKAREVRNINE